MKSIFHISVLTIVFFSVSSCSKDEFTEEFESIENDHSAKVLVIESMDSSESLNANFNDSIMIKVVPQKLIKEVSDGDDESDSGDDSNTGN